MLHHPAEPDENVFCRSRADTMSLNVIKPVDVPRGKILLIKEDSQSLRTEDIERAKPRYPEREIHRFGPPEKDHIGGTRAKTHYPELNRPRDLTLTTGDIEKAQSNAYSFKTQRIVDPLTPRYQLPSYDIQHPEPAKPKFHEGQIRDTLSFKGEWKSRILERNYARDPNETRDIEFSQPNIVNQVTKSNGIPFTPREAHNKTIEQAGNRILTSKVVITPRQSCPLNPTYDNPQRTTHPFMRGHDKESPHAPKSAGPIEGATPRILHRDNGEPQASLIRRDIAGAVPQRYKGAVPLNIYDTHEVTPFVGHLGLDCTDIPGAQPGSRTAGTL